MFLDRICLCGDGRDLMKIHLLFRLVLCAVVVALAGSTTELQAVRPVVKIGVLADLSGSWSTLGKNTVAALQIAAADLENIHPQYRPVQFRFLVRDTHLDPSRALETIRDLGQRGVKIVIGPQSSSEVAMIQPYADAHNILVISQGSTASSLAIPGDNIFRFCPNDIREAEAIVALMRHDGIGAIVNEAGHYKGITGSTALDAAGDRDKGDFDFWAVRLRNGNYKWVRVGTYNNGNLTVF